MYRLRLRVSLDARLSGQPIASGTCIALRQVHLRNRARSRARRKAQRRIIRLIARIPTLITHCCEPVRCRRMHPLHLDDDARASSGLRRVTGDLYIGWILLALRQCHPTLQSPRRDPTRCDATRRLQLDGRDRARIFAHSEHTYMHLGHGVSH